MEVGGKVSEWNEGTFKTIRLHEIQGTINLLKMDPMGRSEGRFNYEWLLNNIDALYGEGYSKYTKDERDRVDRIRKACYDSLKLLPPHKTTIENSMGRAKTIHILNKQNFEHFMELIELFVRDVKDFNDDHGLTTKNRGEGGLF